MGKQNAKLFFISVMSDVVFQQIINELRCQRITNKIQHMGHMTKNMAKGNICLNTKSCLSSDVGNKSWPCQGR